MQLIRFQVGDRDMLIQAADEWSAREKLKQYLKRHPMLLVRYEDCRCKEVCGHVADGIYTLGNK